MADQQSFEELVSQLEERARKLEAGNIPLEEAMTTYEEGAALVEQLRKLLGEAELRVQRLQGSLEEGATFQEDPEPYDDPASSDDDA